MCSPDSESCELHKKWYGSGRTGSYGLGITLRSIASYQYVNSEL